MQIGQELQGQFADQLREYAPLGPQSWFRVGGNARYLFKPKSLQDLSNFCQKAPNNLTIIPLGACSNVIIDDEGIDGVVVKLTSAFAKIDVRDDMIIAGAGALDATLAKVAAKEGVTGFEFLIGIPGKIGGALRMNAGAYGQEIKDILIDLQAVHIRTGEIRNFTCEEMGYSYRHSLLPEDYIFTSARFKAIHGKRETIQALMNKIIEDRSSTQPIASRTGGSTFKNPKGNKRAWELIDAAGARGLRVGGAKMSELHCNFMINEGEASAKDLIMLGNQVKKRVFEHSSILLEWEIRYLGGESDEKI